MDLGQYWPTSWLMMAPSHYIYQCWLFISAILWHSPENNFTGSALATILKDEFENYSLLTYHQGADQLKKYPYESESESNLYWCYKSPKLLSFHILYILWDLTWANFTLIGPGKFLWIFRERSTVRSLIYIYMYISNHIFILYLTSGFNGLGKDNCKTRQESFKFCDLVHLILYILQ